LSIGTGAISLPVVAHGTRRERGLVDVAQRPGLIHDVMELAESILDDPPDSASFEAWVMLGNPVPATHDGRLLASELRESEEPVSLIRMNPLVRPRKDAAGNWIPPQGLSQKEFRQITNIELDARVPSDVRLLVKLARAWLDDQVLNQPIRENPYTFEPRIGHTKFTDALEAWQARTDKDSRTAAPAAADTG
jgi:uncharacterized protein